MYYTGLAPKYEIGGYVTIGRSVLCTHKSYVDRLEVIYVHSEKIWEVIKSLGGGKSPIVWGKLPSDKSFQ